MTNGSELKSPAAKALREAGYRPLPRWWVLADELDAIHRVAQKHEAEVRRIRNEAKGQDDE